MAFYISGTNIFIRDNRNFDSSEFDSTGVKLYIFIHNEVRDFDKNSTQLEIQVNRVRDNEIKLYLVIKFSPYIFDYQLKRCILSKSYHLVIYITLNFAFLKFSHSHHFLVIVIFYTLQPSYKTVNSFHVI